MAKQYVLTVESTINSQPHIDSIHGPYGQQEVVAAQDELRKLMARRNDDRRVWPPWVRRGPGRRGERPTTSGASCIRARRASTAAGIASKASFHFLWNDMASARRRSDGYWICNTCWTAATEDHDGEECHRCRDWSPCGNNCTLTRIRCRTCGALQDA
jgi:hypothetical protein